MAVRSVPFRRGQGLGTAFPEYGILASGLPSAVTCARRARYPPLNLALRAGQNRSDERSPSSCGIPHPGGPSSMGD